MASVLEKKGILFRVAGAEQTSLADLRMQPVILIGAVDNKWTLRLMQGLRYRFEVVRPLGPHEAPVASIADAEQPSNRPTTVGCEGRFDRRTIHILDFCVLLQIRHSVF